MLLLNQQVHVPVSVNFRVVEIQLLFGRFLAHWGIKSSMQVKLFNFIKKKKKGITTNKFIV